MLLTIKIERDADGRFHARVPQIAGAHGVGASVAEATAQAQANALRLMAADVESGTRLPDISADNFRVVAEVATPRPSAFQAALAGAMVFGGIGILTIATSQWWISSQIAQETGRSFAAQFDERSFSFVTTWTSVLALFVIAGSVLGGLTVKLRDWIRRPLFNGESGAWAV